MRKKIRELYEKWLDLRILNKESQLINTEEKILKLTTKKTKFLGTDKTQGIVATAKLRFFKYRQSERYSTEEKMNYAYARIKFNPVTSFFRGIFSFTRKYRFLTGFFGYLSLIVAAVQTGVVFIFSSVFSILLLPFAFVLYAVVAIPLRIKIKRYSKRISQQKKKISFITVDGISYDNIKNGYTGSLVNYLSKDTVCVISSLNITDNFFAVKKIDDNVYYGSHRFTVYLKKHIKNDKIYTSIML